ncbi:MAG: dihydroorotase [Ruminococcaceae bacterium]|nr:dihydroorotase [Oscillospiraceae bacterium]
MKILLKGGNVYENGSFSKKDVAVNDGIVSEISSNISVGDFDIVFDVSDKAILPGFVDVHVHLREPGFSYKETIESGTLAAAKGGYCAVCSMPNLNPAPDSVENIMVQKKLIDEGAKVRVYPYAAITVGRKGRGELADMESLSGHAVAFSDDGTGVQTEKLMEEAMIKAASLDKIIAAHCEDESLLFGGYIHDGEYAKAHGHKGISSESEWAQVRRDISLAKKTGVKYHVCHISTKETVELIRQAKADGVDITCETAPHYLVLSDNDLKESGAFKMNPPIRSKSDKEALIEGIKDGTIDMIATDHAPHSKEEKSKGLEKSMMGIVGLETAFGVLYTHLVQKGIITFERLVELMSINPAKRFEIDNELKAGKKANLTVIDTKAQYTVKPSSFLSKGRSTPFEGMHLTGESILTFSDGKIAWRKK